MSTTQVDFYLKIKDFCLSNGYEFIFGAGQWSNITHKTNEDEKKYIILEIQNVEWGTNTSDSVDHYKIKAGLFLAKHDTIANLYEEKYDEIIAPLTPELEDVYTAIFGVSSPNIKVNSLSYQELVNYIDINLTGPGFIIDFTWSKY